MHILYFSLLGCRELSRHSLVMFDVSVAMSSCRRKLRLLLILSEVSKVPFIGDITENQLPSLPSMARQLSVASSVFCKFFHLGNPEVSFVVTNYAKLILETNCN